MREIARLRMAGSQLDRNCREFDAISAFLDNDFVPPPLNRHGEWSKSVQECRSNLLTVLNVGMAARALWRVRALLSLMEAPTR